MKRKSSSQKRQDLYDTHEILQVYYRVMGEPAGCTISSIPMKGVPPAHRKIADAIVSEFRKRQLSQACLSVDSLEAFERIVKRVQTNLFNLRDHLPRYIQQDKHLSKPETIQPKRLTKIILQNGGVLMNDFSDHNFMAVPEGYFCQLTGEVIKHVEIAGLEWSPS